MDSRFFLDSVACGVMGIAGCAGQDEPQRPNVLFILADDLGIADLGCYGSNFYETPNLDTLAADGVQFVEAYAACPVSSPTRASILTGKYPVRVGITDWIPGRGARPGANDAFPLRTPDNLRNLPDGELTLAEAFREAGYSTLFVGKWHLGEAADRMPENHGFEINRGGGKYGHPPKGYFSPYGLPNLPDGPKGEYLTDRLGEECVRLIGSRDPTKPFLLFYSLYQVHTPLQAREDKTAYFREKAARLGLPDTRSVTTDKAWIREIPVKGRFAERLVQSDPVYAAMISHMDENVGKVIAALKEAGLYENTIIVFTSDNGGLSTAEGSPTSNLPCRAGKGWVYEGGIRVPLLVRWPGRTAGGVVNRTVVTSPDFYPTLLEMTRLPLRPAQHTDGVSFAHALESGKTPDRPAVFWHYPHYSNQGGRPCSAVREGRYKLIQHHETMRAELYDLENDPGEMTDISATQKHLTAAMLRRLERWREASGAQMPERKDAAAGD